MPYPQMKTNSEITHLTNVRATLSYPFLGVGVRIRATGHYWIKPITLVTIFVQARFHF